MANVTRVFVTAGHNRPFDRLLRLVEPLAADPRVELLVQKGYASEAFPRLPGKAFFERAEFECYLGWADVIITQGGAGAIYEACRAGHLPIVVARRAQLGEHVNDHQWQMAAALAARGLVQLYEEGADLLQLVLVHRSRRTSGGTVEPPLVRAVRMELLEPRSRRIIGRGVLGAALDLLAMGQRRHRSD